MKWIKLLGMIGGLGLAVQLASATIVGTYVDAVANSANGTVNTTPASAFPGSFTYSGSFTDAKWDERIFSGTHNNTVIEGGAFDFEDTPVLTTTVGVPLGDYNVYVLYYDFVGVANWGIRAALNNSNPTTGYDETSGFDTGFTVSSGAITLREVLLGQVLSATSFSVSVDNTLVNGGAPTAGRTWYDGVAFEIIAVPEPSAVLLLLVGGLMTWRGRKKFGV